MLQMTKIPKDCNCFLFNYTIDGISISVSIDSGNSISDNANTLALSPNGIEIINKK